jgi:hypothetical protein
MDTPFQPPDQRPLGTDLQTADELLARPDCTHIITLNNPDQNLHLERTAEGFQFTAGSPGTESPYSRGFPSLDAVYQDWDMAPVRHFSLREAIWQDISAYPAFPSSVLWRPLESPVELHLIADSERATAHGPLAVFGPAEIATPAPYTYHLTATSGWLIVEHPAYTMRGRGGRGILRPTRTLLDRLRLYLENRRLRRDTRMWTHVRPGVTVVYGKPPADWQTVRQLLPAALPEQPVPPAPPA